ncbi:adenylate/guanylate cyclase domain-containing protein [candidate division KSB1 bacterium]|nr:adenylate/guanylate cyclase domain-containing protein [candidate division KSB1 bacterium]RQW06710.1 MAG: adenylate/guanylate cyclase domain-containing protein [candidate division KSB1 bacterium]
MIKIKTVDRRHIFAVCIILGAVFIARFFNIFSVVESMQLKTIDSFFKFRGPVQPPDTSIVIVGIDDKTLSSLAEKWPLPGRYYGRLVKNLTRGGARAIVFDIEFFETNAREPQEDFAFSDAIQQARNVILAGKIIYETGRRGVEDENILRPNPWLLESGVPWGTVNSIEDTDGFMRRYILFLEYKGEAFYPLAIEAYKQLFRPTIPKEANRTGKEFILGERRIPKIDANTMMINYRGPAETTFKTFSFVDVVDDADFELVDGSDTDAFEYHLTWETFKDKIVFVGAAAEELHDIKFTPFYYYKGKRVKMPGVETHANALSTIMRGDFIRKIDPFVDFSILIVLVVLATICILYLKPLQATLLILVEMALLRFIAYKVFLHRGLIIDVTMPLIAVLFSYMSGLVFTIITERREKVRIRRIFQHYMSPTIVNQMIDSGKLPEFGGERRELTVLFSDIRQFSHFSEKHEPEFVVKRLSDYLTQMVDIIFANNGTLDKFVGDEIMALFGTPYYFADHAEKACCTAVEMMNGVRLLQKKWAAENSDYFDIGIGINSGNALVGNLGSKQIFDYTVIGNEINLGARLESANKIYQTFILISENTYQLAKDKIVAREIDHVRVVGIQKPVRIYELRAMEPLPQIEEELIMGTFAEALELYKSHRWGDALKAFRRILRHFPSDGPSRLYTVRCLDFLEHPPDPDWDGVHELKQK